MYYELIFFSMLQWELLMMTIPPAALTSAFNVNGLQDVPDAPRAVSLWFLISCNKIIFCNQTVKSYKSNKYFQKMSL